MSYKIFEYDPTLLPYEQDIEIRMDNYERKKRELVGDDGKLIDFADGHKYFGFHRTDGGWVYREWAPGADEMYLTGDMVDWRLFDLKMTPVGNGCFEVYLDGENALWNGCHVQAIVKRGDAVLRRIPSYIRRVEQDKSTFIWWTSRSINGAKRALSRRASFLYTSAI